MSTEQTERPTSGTERPTSGDGDLNAGSYSNRTPDEIEEEIEHTRQRLTETLEALESKLSPRERLHAATRSAVEMGNRLARSTQRALSPDITTMIRMDHTHVLALFRRYRPGTSLARKRALVANACLALEIHATLEEEIFYPELAALGHDQVLDKSEAEHDQMRRLIESLRATDPGDAGYDDTVRELMRTVLHHVADEESVLLPRAEELMGDRLGELGVQMTKRRLQLLKPHLGEVAITTARSFPIATAAVASGALALVWLMLRPSRDRLS
jgi:hemerythrin superfamily protein